MAAKSDWAFIQERFGQGLTQTEVAKQAGVSTKTVYRIWSRMPGWKPAFTPRHGYSPELLERAREMLEDRAGYTDTANTLGVDRKRLRDALPGYGLTPHEVGERAMMEHKFLALPDTL